MRVVDVMAVRRKFGLKCDEVRADWRKLHSEKLHYPRTAPDMIKKVNRGR